MIQMLKVTNFTKIQKNGQRTVDSLNLDVYPGDVYGIVGNNGAGKTTVLEAIAGETNFEAGDIKIDGVSVKSNPISWKFKVAYVPESPELFNNLTGIQYLNFVCDSNNLEKEECLKLIDRYCEVLQLGKKLSSPISTYTRSVKKKVALVAALITKPKLLLLDEPFVDVNPKGCLIIKKIISELSEEGCSIVFSTNALNIADDICNKIVILKGGKAIKCGFTRDVRRKYSFKDIKCKKVIV